MPDLDKRLSASVYPFYEAAEGLAGSAVTTAPMVEVVRKILGAGLGVEIWVGEYDYRPFTEEAVAGLEQVCRDAGPVTMHTRVEGWDPGAVSTEIALSARLGAEVLVVHPGTLGLADGPEDWAAVRGLAAEAKAGGLVLALENSGKIGIAPLRRAVERLGDDPAGGGFGLCIDVGHAHRSRRVDGVLPQTYLEEFRPAIVEVHVHDNFGDKDLHLVPGRGSIEWDALRPAFRGLGDRTIVCIEVKCAGTPLGTIRAAQDFLAARVGPAEPN